MSGHVQSDDIVADGFLPLVDFWGDGPLIEVHPDASEIHVAVEAVVESCGAEGSRGGLKQGIVFEIHPNLLAGAQEPCVDDAHPPEGVVDRKILAFRQLSTARSNRHRPLGDVHGAQADFRARGRLVLTH